MRLIQAKGGVITLSKKIIYQPLQKSFSYKELVSVLVNDERPTKWPDTYYRDQIASLVRRIGQVLQLKYEKSGWSKTSAFTRGAHTHFRKEPDLIHKEGEETEVDTKWLLDLSSGRYVNKVYDIQSIVDAKEELVKLLEGKS